MNVLVTCAGRRVSLVQAFQEAVHRRGGRVSAGDCDPLAPALFVADQPLVLRNLSHPDYIPVLLERAAACNIRLLVPTIDTELPLLAEYAEAFSRTGCRVLVSEPSFVHHTLDKWETARRFDALGIRTVPTWLPDDLVESDLPSSLFVKPRRGSASRQTFRVDRERLASALTLVPDAIVQPHLTAPEISVDALLDFEGRLIHYVPRRRIRTLAGESIQGVTLPDDDLRPWLVDVLEHAGRLGARGVLTLQAFLLDDGPVLSEINARFGGGFPLTLAAGGDYPEWILRLLDGEAVEPRIGSYERDLYMTRHHSEIFTTQLYRPDGSVS